MLKVLIRTCHPAKKYNYYNVAKNRISKAVPKSSSKRRKRRAKLTVNMSMRSSFIGAMNKLNIPMRGSFCYIIDDIHLRLLTQHMKIWNIAINEQEGDIDTMSAALAKSFMSTKLEIKNPLRENGAKSSDKTASPHSSLTSAPTSTSISMLLLSSFFPILWAHIMNLIINQNIHHLYKSLYTSLHPSNVLDNASHHFHQNMIRAQTNSLIILHDSSNDIPSSLNNSLYTWKCFKRKILYLK